MRHIVDGAQTRRGTRLKHFVTVERRAKVSRRFVRLQRVPKHLNTARRLRRFLRIMKTT